MLHYTSILETDALRSRAGEKHMPLSLLTNLSLPSTLASVQPYPLEAPLVTRYSIRYRDRQIHAQSTSPLAF